MKEEKKVQNYVMSLVRMLISVIEEKDPFLRGHAERVARYAVSFSKKLGMKKWDIEKIYLAGLLHDLGMVYMPYEIIQKPGELTEEEMETVKQHPIIAEKIVSKVSVLAEISPIIRHHHEAFDGSGYPDGLKGAEIPIGARIMLLADTYDSMVAARPHRSAIKPLEALREIMNNKKRRFDPALISDFVDYISSIEGLSTKKKVSGDKDALREMIMAIVQRYQKGDIDLPHLPKIVHEIIEVIHDPKSNVDDLAAVIEQDGVISLKLISMSNSLWYGGIEKIYSVRRAIPRLGYRETQGIVTAIAYRDLYEANNIHYKLLMEKLWLHSLACAFAAKAISKKMAVGDAELLFMMGLLHDIGKVPLLKALSQMERQVTPFHIKDVLECVEEFHSRVAEEIFHRWRFSEKFIDAAKMYEDPQGDDASERMVSILRLADRLTQDIGYGLSENDTGEAHFIETDSMGLNIDNETLDAMGDEIKKVMRNAAHLF
ncbi:MAG: HDOD domain-containing protein [Deltaproteobacteria bacterium]|nr:HDOD domain-containing protein [Deltaproteobacteria bacterium]